MEQLRMESLLSNEQNIWQSGLVDSPYKYYEEQTVFQLSYYSELRAYVD